MGTIRTFEETHHDHWILFQPSLKQETGDFESEEAARDYLKESPDLISRGFLPAYKRVTYEVHSLD